jgi:hypothetical protein
MKTKIISALFLLSNLTYAQTESKKTLPDFTKLQVNISTSVYLKKSDTPYVSYESNDSSKTGLSIDTKDGILLIREKKDKEIPEKITIGYVTLEQMAVAGAATVKSAETITADNLSITTSGAAKCKLDLSVNNITCSVSGASTCSFTGKTGVIIAIVSGASSLKAEELIAEKGQINTSGASTSKVNITSNLTAIVSGASTLKYTGEPKETQINQTGASTVKRIDKDGNSTSSDNNTSSSGNQKDSTRRYTINGRYEIIIHENGKKDTTATGYIRKHDGRIRKQNWAGVDLFENGYLTPDNNITLPSNYDYLSPNYGGRNLGWNLNLFEKDFRFAKGRLQVVTGLGFSFNYYALKNKTTLNADSSYTSSYAYNTSAEYRKNKLRESFVTIPLLFELNTSKRDSRNFHIAFGVIGGMKLGSSTKQIFTVNNHTYETVRHDDYNLFPFKLDATVRVGYGDFVLFATYSLTPLFEYGKGPELYPFTVGLRICPFH